MSEIAEIVAWEPVVAGAAAGDPAAWEQLVEWFQDRAVAMAVGFSGDLASAQDIAQEAFDLAYRHLADLEDPRAFPAWFKQLVRTASARARRRMPRVTVVPLEGMGRDHVDPAAGPDDVAVRTDERVRVRRAVEALPEPERCVVALHYLAGLGYADVAAFLGITESAAKKRAWSARRRLQELLPMTTDALAARRPSRNRDFRDTILLFRAIKAGDTATVAALVERNPALVHASQDWTPSEGMEARLGYAGRATAVIRAAGLGHLEIVRLLVEAGAAVDDVCGCSSNETPLWVATTGGHAAVVDYLLGAGADPNRPAFAGATPLHAAVHRGFDAVAGRLLQAGADPSVADAGGRTAAQWAALKVERGVEPRAEQLWTRIRAIDLFAPLTRGAVQQWPPAYGLGQLILLLAIAQNLEPAALWIVGFEHGPYDGAELEAEMREAHMGGIVRLVPELPDTERRLRFERSLAELAAASGEKLVACVRSPGHTHDVTLALPRLQAERSVLATMVIEPYTPEPPTLPASLPEGYTGRVAFSPVRARRGLWPAVDASRTGLRTYPSARHAELAQRARQLLDRYAEVDPDLELPDPATTAEPEVVARAQELLRYLSHSFRLVEAFTSQPAVETDVQTLLADVSEILGPAT